ncbi:MAG: hypothetical protein QJT81_00065 [Candidatus Thiothrix putei]|uniref:Uncharacterized protein n=1 Tax=Candidatus Thiothrix putei TaxID=3080811 RepID=A0AA95HG40_9GAMM|nr:MAG: hypothetical protein QJT81_00065 [Candidatus Thiothrix putei]
MKQTIIWTVLPNGIVSLADGRRQLRFSIKVSPRLEPGNHTMTLKDAGVFAAWTQNLPTFTVRFAHQQQDIPASPNPDPHAVQRDAGLWAKLFPPNTPIHSYNFKESDFRGIPIRSFPVGNVLGHVKAAVQAAGLHSPEQLPFIPYLVGDLGRTESGGAPPGYLGSLKDLKQLTDIEWQQKWRDDINTELRTQGFLKSQPPQLCRDLMQAQEFYRFSPQEGKYGMLPPRLLPDFHEVVSLLDDYPYLLQRVGLLLDMVCELPAGIDTVALAMRKLRVTPTPLMPTAVSPWTVFDINVGAGVFCAASKTPGVYTEGLLDLSKGNYWVNTLDVDDAAFKYSQFIDSAVHSQNGRRKYADNAVQAPDSLGLPALRSGGISIIQTGRAEGFQQIISNSGKLNDQLTPRPPFPPRPPRPPLAPELTLYAEDLTKGLAVDVRVLRAGPQDQRSGPWRSLCQRVESYRVREGAGFTTYPQTYKGEGVVTTALTSPNEKAGQPEPAGELRLHEALIHWDGWSLAVRKPGRAITDKSDLPREGTPEVPADSRLSVDCKVVANSLPQLRYGRTYALRARAVDLAGNGKKCGNGETSLTGAFPEITFRRYEPVAAPVMAAVISPTRPLKGYVAGESLEHLVIRSHNHMPEDNLKPTADTTARWFVPPRVAQEMAERHGMFEATPPDGKNWYDLINERSGDAAHFPEWAASPLQDVNMKYLPDPLARFTAIRGLPGRTDPLLIKSSAAVWPNIAPFQLVLSEGKPAYTWDETTQVLTVTLPKAAVLRLRVSSALDLPQALDSPQALALLGIWAWLKEATTPERAAKLQELALSGGHWLFTPWRELVLSHAVQRPLEPPRFQQFAPAPRMPGETRIAFSGQVQVHAASTGKVEVGASWFDRVDDKWSKEQLASPFYVTNTAPLQTLLSCAGKTQEFGDSRHRRVTYHATATTLFADCFVDEASDGVVKGLEPVTLDIPSSARPAAPDVDYIIPTFGWELAHEPDWHGKPPVTASQPPEANTVVKSQRWGGSVRVYLRRPWFSSGDGEMLGVVIAPVPALRLDYNHMTESLALPNGLAAVVTQWGYDPIWISHGTYAVPSLHHFPAATVRESGLALEELANSTARVAVAAHPVSFDQERQLWYCDIPMDTGPTYFPFVRLALARYQPCSVQGVELSRVTLADFIQLAPDRSATVVSDPRDPCMVHLSVSGTFPIAPTRWRISEKLAFASVVMVRTEMLDPTDTQGQTWLPTGTPTQLIPSHVTLAASVWMGEIRLPSARGSQRFRLLIQEEEVLEEDLRTAEVGALLAINRPPTRTVYTDVIEI